MRVGHGQDTPVVDPDVTGLTRLFGLHTGAMGAVVGGVLGLQAELDPRPQRAARRRAQANGR